jgi:4-hydroxybenzoate polyprenyltransferase
MIPVLSNGPQRSVLRALQNTRFNSLRCSNVLQLPARRISSTKQPNYEPKQNYIQQIDQNTTKHSLISSLKQRALPYWYLARLDKPIGTVLLYLPCSKLHPLPPTLSDTIIFIAWSITMASYATTASPYVLGSNLFLFGVGAILLRGSGCVINDLWDRDLDKGVERTRSRPLASGALSTQQAVGFFGLQLTGGLVILTQLNWFRYVEYNLFSAHFKYR